MRREAFNEIRAVRGLLNTPWMTPTRAAPAGTGRARSARAKPGMASQPDRGKDAP